jgi:ElaB/YqjD/DUF883 family membrane-anchored ribosome-binding protein
MNSAPCASIHGIGYHDADELPELLDGGIMLVIFKSKAAAEIIMYEQHAKRMLDLLGKDVKRGIITAEESAGAIATLEAEIARERARLAEEARQEVEAADDFNHDKPAQPLKSVSFATRTYPLLEMLRAAQARKQDVVWGV